jgi:NAD(P)H-dependent FMN reductase
MSSTRPGRAGEAVAKWVMEQAKHDDINFELIDLGEVNLPFLDEPVSAMMDQYTKDHTKAWGKVIEGADGFIIVTAEYNHGYPAPLKNALDFLYKEWNSKPVGFVSYGATAGGTRAVQQLKQVALQLQLRPLFNEVAILEPIYTVVADGKLTATEAHGEALDKVVAELAERLG